MVNHRYRWRSTVSTEVGADVLAFLFVVRLSSAALITLHYQDESRKNWTVKCCKNNMYSLRLNPKKTKLNLVDGKKT